MPVLIISLLFLTACATPVHAIPAPKTPTIYISYSFLFDQVCEKISSQKIPLAAKTEGPARLDEFVKQWRKDSPDFFRILVNRIGRGFERNEETVSLTSCDIPGVSDPILISLKRWLVSLGGHEPMYGFSDVVFHELLHRYLASNFDANKSILLKKYKNEGPQVLTHLHLMALQKMIYTELKRNDLLTWLDHDYNQLIGGDYKRAWDIVSSIESPEAFMNELSTMSK